MWWLGFCVCVCMRACVSSVAICDCTNMYVTCHQLMAYGSRVKSGVQEAGSTCTSTTTSCTVCINSALIPSGSEPDVASTVDSIMTRRSQGWWLPGHSAMEAYIWWQIKVQSVLIYNDSWVAENRVINIGSAPKQIGPSFDLTSLHCSLKSRDSRFAVTQHAW